MGGARVHPQGGGGATGRGGDVGGVGDEGSGRRRGGGGEEGVNLGNLKCYQHMRKAAFR